MGSTPVPMKLFRAQDPQGRVVVLFSESARRRWLAHNPGGRPFLWSEARRIPRHLRLPVARFVR